MHAMPLAPELRLPWESTAEDDRRFLKLLRNMLLAFGALAVAVPLLPVPDVSREKIKVAPPELVQVVLEEKTLPEPVKPPPKPVEKVPEPPAPVTESERKTSGRAQASRPAGTGPRGRRGLRSACFQG